MGVVFVSTAPLFCSVDLSSQIIFPKTSFIPPRMYKKYRLRRNKTTFSLFFSVIIYYLMSPKWGIFSIIPLEYML